MWLTIAWQSLLNRRFSVVLTFVALVISVSLLFAIEHIRVQTQENFKRTVSGVDFVVCHFSYCTDCMCCPIAGYTCL